MAIKAKVIGRNYYTRINGEVREAPIGHEVIVRAIPEAMKGKLQVIKEVDDKEYVVNDTPESAKLRDEGQTKEADAALAKAKEAEPAKAKKKAAEAAKKKAAEAGEK